ncbi:hypothetical protein ACVWW4_000779, partial [Bradyrhizobium sp. LB7.1]
MIQAKDQVIYSSAGFISGMTCGSKSKESSLSDGVQVEGDQASSRMKVRRPATTD